MSGWNLKEGLCLSNCNSENEFWKIVNNIFSNKTNKTTSYKYGFFKSVLDNIFNINENFEIEFGVIFERFAEIYWNLVVKYGLCQIQSTSSFSKSSIEIILEKILVKYPVEREVPFESLNNSLKEEIIKSVTNVCSKYVIGAFYKDTNCSFYSFDKKIPKIKFATNVVEYFIKYKNVLGKLNYFEWIKFLEKTNPNEKALLLAEKLDNSSKRGNLSYYRDFLQDLYGKPKCFYCNIDLSNRKIEIDHFIPWSFIKDDKIWNMVISCRECNNKKRDKLPEETYIGNIVEQNKRIVYGKYYKSISKEYFGYSDTLIKKIYYSAKYNGFTETWAPKKC